MICKPFDVVDVPFPFIDSSHSKFRKALVISKSDFNKSNRASILAMITSATYSKWYGDVIIMDWKKAGLKKSCFMRWKLFTIQNSLIKRKIGSLSLRDRNAFRQSLSSCLKLLK